MEMEKTNEKQPKVKISTVLKSNAQAQQQQIRQSYKKKEEKKHKRNRS